MRKQMSRASTISFEILRSPSGHGINPIIEDAFESILSEELTGLETSKLENEIFESYLLAHKDEPQSGTFDVLSEASFTALSCSSLLKKRFSSYVHSTRTALLSARQKCQIAKLALRDLKTDIEMYMENANDVISHFQAEIETKQTRLSELDPLRAAFQKDVVVDGFCSRTGTVTTESFLRHNDKRLKYADMLISKILVQNSNYRARIKENSHALKQAKLLKEDFSLMDHLYQQMRNESNIALLKWVDHTATQTKYKSSRLTKRLNEVKAELQKVMDENARLLTQYTQQKNWNRCLNAKLQKTRNEENRLTFENNELLKEKEEYAGPTLHEYVKKTIQQYLPAYKRYSSLYSRNESNNRAQEHRKLWADVLRPRNRL